MSSTDPTVKSKVLIESTNSTNFCKILKLLNTSSNGFNRLG